MPPGAGFVSQRRVFTSRLTDLWVLFSTTLFSDVQALLSAIPSGIVRTLRSASCYEALGQ